MAITGSRMPAGAVSDDGLALRPARPPALPRAPRPTWPGLATTVIGVMALVVVAATLRAYLQGAMGYVDNGDGYYLYAARRVAQGAVLYRDVMGTQPPLVYLLGAAVFKLGGTLPALRLASAAMRALSTLLVFGVGCRLFGGRLTAALGALIFALLPIGLTWDRSFDVNPPLTLLALLAIWPLLRWTPRSSRLAGVLAALALFTKNLYAPVLLATLVYLALRRRRLLAPYLQALGAGLGALALALLAYAGPAGLHDAFLGQQSSPFNADWFVAALAYVLANEGAIVLVAGAGAALCWRQARTGAAHEPEGLGYAPWWLGGASAVLLATLKEGTAGPVFQFAEPAVALLAACTAMRALHRVGVGVESALRYQNVGALPAPAVTPRRSGAAHSMGMHRPFRRALRPSGLSEKPGGNPVVSTLALAVPVVLGLSLATLAGGDLATLRQNNAAQVAGVVGLVRAHARPGQTIVAPPYYALLTDTRLPRDAADTYILAQRIRRGEPWATRWMRDVSAKLAARRIPIVLIDLRSAAIAPLMAAVRAHYRPLPFGDGLPPALHVTAWLPK